MENKKVSPLGAGEPALNGLSVKYFSSEFDKTLWWCSTLCVLQFHQVLLKSVKNKKVLHRTNLMDGLSIRGRWIGPKANDFKKCQYGICQSREPTCRDATKRGHIALETQDLSFCNTKTDGSN